MATPTQLRFNVGDVPRSRTLTVQNADGSLYNLTGSVVTWNMYLPSCDPSVSRTLTVTSLTDSTCLWTFQQGDMATAGLYTNDLVVTATGVTESFRNFAWIVVDPQ